MSTTRATQLWLGLSAALLFACCDGSTPSALSLLGESCRLNSDCEGGLACVFGVCHEECSTTKDCPEGRCIVGDGRVRHCQPAAASACALHSDCLAPLVCGRDGRCRNECAADRDCVPGQRCTAATCAEPDELDEDGQLPEAGPPLGKPCLYASDCAVTDDGLVLVCRSGACSYACFEERDCGRFERCSTADDPTLPGNCELVANADELVCDPDDPNDTIACWCTGSLVLVACQSDGKGYEACPCP